MMRTPTFVWIAVVGVTLLGCSSTAEMSKIQISSSSPLKTTTIQLVDARAQEARIYRIDGNIQYLGDNNFETPPAQLIATRFNEKLGDLLSDKEVSLLEFQARISAPFPQTYPGMPLASEILGTTLRLPQLGNPYYANVSLRGKFQQKEFTGAKSVEFYIGSGEAEIAEAFNAAVSEATTNLQLLLMNEGLRP